MTRMMVVIHNECSTKSSPCASPSAFEHDTRILIIGVKQAQESPNRLKAGDFLECETMILTTFVYIYGGRGNAKIRFVMIAVIDREIDRTDNL